MSPPPSRFLRLLAPLVPAPRRREWVREWVAEAVHARASRRSSLAMHLAALEDALVLRARALPPGPLHMSLRHALRALLRQPGFTALVVLTLGLGLGASVTLFSAVRGIVLRPLPYADAGQVALVTASFRGDHQISAFPASVPEYLELKEKNPAFADLAGYFVGTSNLGGLDEPSRATVVTATANVLDVLGVSVTLGRGFAPGEDRPSAERVALLSDALWQESWGGKSDAVGEEVRIDGVAHTVIGVLPADFEFPGAEPDLVRAVRIDPADPGGRSSHWLNMVARLRSGLDVPAARAETTRLLERWEAEFPDRHGLSPDGHPVLITGVREAIVGDMGRPLRVLGAAVLLLLLVACFNVANLLLARGEDRRREFGVRTALGAGRVALVRQLLVESGLLALAGGVVGVALSAGALRILPVLAGGTLPPNSRLPLDGPVLAASALLVSAVAVVFGLLPALAARSDVAGALRDGGGRTTSGRRRLAFRQGLVVAEVAAAVALIAGAAVLGRGLGEILAVDPGLDVEGVALFDVDLNAAVYPGIADVAAFHRELRARAEALPGVTAAGALRAAPFSGDAGWESVDVPGETPPEPGHGTSWNVQYQVVDPGVFRALGIPVLAGRAIEERDDQGAPLVVVVNLAAVRELWGTGADPVGRELRLGSFEGNTNSLMRVVGVVGDTRQSGLDRDPPPQIFVPRAQAAAHYGGLGARFATVAVRTRGDAKEILPSLRALVQEMDPQLPFASPRTLGEQVARSVGDRRFLAVLTGTFSAVAALLGAIGLYGLMAYVVRRRSHEFGIRFALGAARGRVVRGVVGEAVALVGLGAAAGVALAWASAGILDGLVYGVAARDPVALAGAPLVLLTVGLLAAWLPAHRASRVDPARVLREE